MAPSPEEWEEDEEEGDEGDGPDNIGDDYDVDNGGDDYDSDSFFSDVGSSSSDSVRGHCWPDPFDTGTEASTPARSSRSPSVDDLSRLSSSRLRASDEHSCDEASDTEIPLHDDYAVVLSAAAEIARCADARFGFERRTAERKSVLRVQPLPKALLEVLHGRFPKAAQSPLSSAEGHRGIQSSWRGDFRSISRSAWQGLFSDFPVARNRTPEAIAPAVCSGSTLSSDLDSEQGSAPIANGEFPLSSPVPAPPAKQQATVATFQNIEAVLRAQMDAKQVLMSVVLKVIFSMQVVEQAPETDVEPPLEPRAVEAPETDVVPPLEPRAVEACRRSCSKESVSKSFSSSRGRKLILAPRVRMRQPTRPRQPPPRPEKRPPVPRAPHAARSSSKTSVMANVGEYQKRPIASRGELGVVASSSTSSVADSDEVNCDDLLQPVCYEVSDEEFNRLMQAGSLHGLCEHDGETIGAEFDEAYEVSDEEFERLLQAGVLSMATQEEEAPTHTPCQKASPRQPGSKDVCTPPSEKREGHQKSAPRPPPPHVIRDAPQIRRRSEPAHTRGEPPSNSLRQPRMPPKSAPPKPLGPKPAPKRVGKAGCDTSISSACRGGLFFLPTDGVPAVGSRAGVRGVNTSSSSSREEADSFSEAVYTGAEDMEFHEFIDNYCTAAAGSPLHSARLLRERAAPRSVPSRWEDPPPPPVQRRAPVAPVARFKSPGNLPRIDFRNITAPASSGANYSDFGYESFSGGATSSGHCEFRDDVRGFMPFDDEITESKSLPTRSPVPGRELAWDGGMLPFCGPHGRRVPRKLAPLP